MKKIVEKSLDGVSMTLSFIGGLNWGIIGLTGWFGRQINFVDMIFGYDNMWSNLVYVLVGASVLWLGWKAVKSWFK